MKNLIWGQPLKQSKSTLGENVEGSGGLPNSEKEIDWGTRIPILDEDIVYRRVHRNHIKPDGTIASVAFQMKKLDGSVEDGISVDLKRLTTIEYARGNAENSVAELDVKFVREIGLDAKHKPDKLANNYAHSLITHSNGENVFIDKPYWKKMASYSRLIK